MFEIVFYEDAKGNCPMLEFLDSLRRGSTKSKDSKVQLKQVYYCLERLQAGGTRCGEGITKHIEGDIWELRPGKNRILFFGWRGNSYVLLHVFRKTTAKTPRKEVERAKRKMSDWLNRHEKP
jgi:phage-related protein